MFLPVLVVYWIGETLLQSFSIDLKYLNELYYVVIALQFIEIIRRYFDVLFVLGPRAVTLYRGRLSLRYHRISLKYTDIRETQVDQSIMGRILNYGTLSLSSAATDQHEIVMPDIALPAKYSKYVMKKIKAHAGDIRSGDGVTD